MPTLFNVSSNINSYSRKKSLSENSGNKLHVTSVSNFNSASQTLDANIFIHVQLLRLKCVSCKKTAKYDKHMQQLFCFPVTKISLQSTTE